MVEVAFVILAFGLGVGFADKVKGGISALVAQIKGDASAKLAEVKAEIKAKV